MKRQGIIILNTKKIFLEHPLYVANEKSVRICAHFCGSIELSGKRDFFQHIVFMLKICNYNFSIIHDINIAV